MGFSRDAIGGVPGVRHVTAKDDWIAVIADSWWAAERALKSANPQFSGGRTPQDMRALFDDAMANVVPDKWFNRGNYETAVRGSRPLAATYYVAPSQHLGIETVTATARVSGGTVELWAPTQAPGSDRLDATHYPMPPGEPAGRTLDSGIGAIAVELARAVGRPVQVVLSQVGKPEP